ncbi:MAG: undecaprenyldiphospho-muramoylpentapeptide beta-N-acetylglucosaminyltransferase [Candidatus Omnitrophica bacterium]|nr:undecaprenyldiphospho-muramoylpentapeptide beta-N-acetylglucosaminyltransferase [Candidatus Omnitrophota bacterium]
MRGIVIAAGGTGGHIFPALALAREFKSAGITTLVIGKTTALLQSEFQKAGISFQEIPVVRFPRKKTGLILFPFRAAQAFFSAAACLLRFRPSAVIGMGGYACAAPASVATLLHIPLYFCEQNLLPGKVTRAFSRVSSAVFTSFPDSSRYLGAKRIMEFGNPLRPFAEKNEKAAARQKLKLDGQKFTVLVLGGSQGAHRINQNISESLDYLSPREIQFIHLTGADDLSIMTETYEKKKFQNYAEGFFPEMGLLYSAADLVICRAGATTIAELNFFGLPSILIPYPFAAEDHQRLNASYLAGCGAAILREESTLNGEKLAREIKILVGDRQKLNLMSEAGRRLSHPEPAKHIVSLILSDLARRSFSEGGPDKII